MKLIITRYGETEENIQGIIMGHLPGKLTINGIEQAKKVAERLKDENIDIIFSSDLARASDTAKEIAKFHEVPLEFTKDLREKYLGEWQGKKKKDLGFTSNTSLVNIVPKDGETSEELFNRANNFINKIFSEHSDKTILFVAHNGIIKALMTALNKKSSEDIKLIENMGNTSITIFETDEERKLYLKVFNCIKHLE